MWDLPDLSTTPNHPLMPRHLRLHDRFSGENAGAGIDVVTGRRLVLGNADVRISYAVAREPSPLYRNATGDECVFVEAGAALVQTVFGELTARQGDDVLIPRATVHRWRPITEQGPLRVFAIEGNSDIGPPKRYVSRFGQLLEHSPYCERDLHDPVEPLLSGGSDVEVYTEHRWNGPSGIVGSIVVSPHHPFNAVGWDVAGTAACTRTHSTSPISSRSPGGCTSLRRCTGRRGEQFRRLQFRAAKGGLPPITIHWQSRCPITT